MNSYDKIMWGKIIILFQEVLMDLAETSDEPYDDPSLPRLVTKNSLQQPVALQFCFAF